MSESGLRKAVRGVRQAALSGIRSVGGFNVVADSRWRQQTLLILCYHGVSLKDEHEWHNELFVTKEFLERRLDTLRRHDYSVLELGDAVRQLRKGSLPPRSVVITFDDGFYDFLEAAVPLLEAYGYPATNYVSPYYTERQRPILGLTLRYILWKGRGRTLAAGTFEGQSGGVDLADQAQRDGLAEELFAYSDRYSNDREAQYAWLASVAEGAGVDWDEIVERRLFHLLTLDEVAEVSDRGFDIQLHTHRHRTPRNKDEFCGEVLQNQRILERVTGRPATHFCYPSGDVDAMFLPWLREMGVETATIGVSRLARASDDVLLLPRYIDTMLKPDVMFEAWLSGIGELFTPGRH